MAHLAFGANSKRTRTGKFQIKRALLDKVATQQVCPAPELFIRRDVSRARFYCQPLLRR
jgi:hypothetical protein